MSTKYQVSVCICTRNRPDNLIKALDSLPRSTYPVWEIIVSDDSTNNDTKTLMSSSYPHLKYLPGPLKGLGANRNNALKAVTGSHVLFLDDDAVLGENFIEKAFAYLAADIAKGGDPEKIIVTGLQEDHGILMAPRNQDFLGHQKVIYEDGKPIETVVINSALFPVQVFEKVLFDEKLVYGCDEVDFTSRAVKKGFKIILCLQAINYHYPSLINRDFYQPYHEASRMYVTFKRYFSTDKNLIKTLLFLIVGSVHTTLYSLKSSGIKGIASVMKTFQLTSSYIYLEYFQKNSIPEKQLVTSIKPEEISL